MSKHVIPILLAAFDLVEAVVCAFSRDWARCLYWASAAAITVSTVLMRG